MSDPRLFNQRDLENAMRRLDSDNDGAITREEARRHGRSSDPALRVAADIIQTNLVVRDDIGYPVRAIPVNHGALGPNSRYDSDALQLAHERFEKMDKNRDGSIQQSELDHEFRSGRPFNPMPYRAPRGGGSGRE